MVFISHIFEHFIHEEMLWEAIQDLIVIPKTHPLGEALYNVFIIDFGYLPSYRRIFIQFTKDGVLLLKQFVLSDLAILFINHKP